MADKTPAAAPAEDVADAVKQLEAKLEEMTKDRNAFRAEFQELSKKHDAVKTELAAVKKAKPAAVPAVAAAVKAKDKVVAGGKSREVIDVTDGDAALHKLWQNVGDARTLSLWIEVR
ncbi:MAG: hypothetical protein ACYDHY_07305 [Acidiferrobacterales bacterium]